MFYIEKKETITAKFNDINNANFAAMMNLIKEQEIFKKVMREEAKKWKEEHKKSS